MKNRVMFLAILAVLTLSPTLSAQNWDYYESKKVEPKPTFMGGDIKEFKDWVESHLTPLSKYDNLEGIETMEFVISPDGHVRASDKVENVSDYERQLRKDLVRVIDSAPQWEPGLRKGKPIYVHCKSSFVFPVSYEGMKNGTKTPPKFNGGGLDQFEEWVKSEIVYSSEIVKNKGDWGTVTVRFLIEKDGRVTNVDLVNGCDPELDNQILRIVSSSPQWTSFDIPNCKKVAATINVKARYGDETALLKREEQERIARQRREEQERVARQKYEEETAQSQRYSSNETASNSVTREREVITFSTPLDVFNFLQSRVFKSSDGITLDISPYGVKANGRTITGAVKVTYIQRQQAIMKATSPATGHTYTFIAYADRNCIVCDDDHTMYFGKK